MIDEPTTSHWRSRMEDWPIAWILVGISVIAAIVIIAELS